MEIWICLHYEHLFIGLCWCSHNLDCHVLLPVKTPGLGEWLIPSKDETLICIRFWAFAVMYVWPVFHI